MLDDIGRSIRLKSQSDFLSLEDIVFYTGPAPISMKHLDFQIGTEFYTCTGQKWLCTDVGSRTILAIELKPDLDPSWFIGPPYAVVEIPFDEDDIRGAYRNQKESLEDVKNTIHPGFPNEVVTKMFAARALKSTFPYKNKPLLRIDRVGEDGEILHPYAAEEKGNDWSILVYGLFDKSFRKIAESDFIKMPHAKHEDLKLRRDKLSIASK